MFVTPRMRLDISWSDFGFGGLACVWPGSGPEVAKGIEASWQEERSNLVCLSVRSGFDALLSVLDFPPGSEILVSAVTIRDMVKIVEAHGLVAVPVDLDFEGLAVDEAAFARAVTPRTRAVLVAHLFGAHASLDPVISLARCHGLLVLEDCAQAYTGRGFRGHPESDVVLWSFGAIKTATALAGAVVSFREPELAARVEAQQQRWPVLTRLGFAKRLTKYFALHLLSSPPLYSLFVALCRALGKDYDALVGTSARGFAGGNFFTKIRQRPSPPLVRLLARRLRSNTEVRVGRRRARAEELLAQLPELERPGRRVSEHSHWVFPIFCDAPDSWRHALVAQGFDATRGASSMAVVEPPPDRPECEPANARAAFARLLYLPVGGRVSSQRVTRLAQVVPELVHSARQTDAGVIL